MRAMWRGIFAALLGYGEPAPDMVGAPDLSISRSALQGEGVTRVARISFRVGDRPGAPVTPLANADDAGADDPARDHRLGEEDC